MTRSYLNLPQATRDAIETLKEPYDADYHSPEREVVREMGMFREQFFRQASLVKTRMVDADTTDNLVTDLEMMFDRLYGVWVHADKERLRLEKEYVELEERLESKPEPDGLSDLGSVFDKWVAKSFPDKELSEDAREILYDGWLVAYHQALKEKLVSQRMSHHNLRETLDREFRKVTPPDPIGDPITYWNAVRDSVVAALHGMEHDPESTGIFNFRFRDEPPTGR